MTTELAPWTYDEWFDAMTDAGWERVGDTSLWKHPISDRRFNEMRHSVWRAHNIGNGHKWYGYAVERLTPAAWGTNYE